MSFFNELKRRNVLRVGAAYIVTAWLIVQVAETLFPIYGLSDASIRMVVNVLALGLVPVLVLAWVFEWTPEGLKKDSDAAQGTATSLQAARRLDRIILIILALALGYFAIDKFVFAPQQMAEELAEAREEGRTEAMVESYGDQSIAVLPFTNMSSDPEQEYFGDGLAEEVLNLLAGIPEMRVISRSSAFTFKGSNLPVPEIAEQLKVAHILEGSVRKAGNQIRITAQLIEAKSDRHLWSQTWDRTLDDIFAIQDEIARDVVDNLELRLAGSVPTTRRTNPEAYALTLRARHEMEFISEGYERRAEDLLNRALEIDPYYVPAHEAAMWLEISKYSGDPQNADFYYQQRRSKILAIEPDNPLVQGFDAWDLFVKKGEVEEAAQILKNLVENNLNNTEILQTAAAFLRRIGKYQAAIPLAQHCVRLDPLRITCIWLLKETLLWAGELDLAREYMERLRVIWNDPIRMHDVLLLLMLKDFDAAESLIETWPPGREMTIFRAMAAFGRGDSDSYHAYRNVLMTEEESAHDSISHLAYTITWNATLEAFVGNHDMAFEWLEKLATVNRPNARQELFSPGLQSLHDDPRWTEYRERLNMGEARLSAIEFNLPPGIPAREARLGLD